ncbi:hypothetical protein LTS18_014211 [Coniosporium uncinatum]|uniref:Uncharacterized protein n=2 Tax=Coniosporium uncinatum TaxID=93489 RepID=A0ACC3CT18_9PEZI|nr:hypothetical protein LTS18_001679 [Coniosporium uncinatum]KAK3074648.1 hypothetical protein LTS18_014211 [Coniosporium uncinatum]
MISRQGMYEADGKTMKNKVKATIAHAVTNDIVLAVAAYSWYARRSAATDSLAGKMGVGGVGTGAATYEPTGWMVVASAVTAALLMFGANLGGTLTYNYGIGFAPLKGASVKKAQ